MRRAADRLHKHAMHLPIHRSSDQRQIGLCDLVASMAICGCQGLVEEAGEGLDK